MMDIVWDLGRLLWLSLLLLVAVCVPAAVGARRRRPAMMTLLPHLVVIALLAVVAVSLLSPAHLLNPITLLLAYACWPAGRWLVTHRRSVAVDARNAVQKAVLTGALAVERAGTGRQGCRTILVRTVTATRSYLRAAAADLATPQGTLLMAAIVLAVVPRCMEALVNTRLSNADAYAELITAQQLFAGEADWGRPRVVAALIAASSVVSSIGPVHLIRMLLPIASVAALLSLIASVRATTGSITAVIIAVLTAGLVAPERAATLSDEVAGMFVLLSVMFWFETLLGRRDTRWVAISATVMVAMLQPQWLIVVGTGVTLMLLAPSATWLAVGAAWLLVASLVDTAAPLGWAVLAAGVAHLAGRNFAFRRPPVRAAFAAAAAILVFSVINPRRASADYVEYDASARLTIEIASRFPKYRWMIAAPTEQWALSYGRGWHINLHEFVEAHGAAMTTDGYRLPYQVDDLFVFIETRPFATFPTEPVDVPFATLVDPVYRHYRSLAGRASLQFTAYQLVERLRADHPGAGVYFDDGRLRIYRFPLR